MSRRESKRLPLIHQAWDRKITQVAAAEVLGLSARQFRRLLKRGRAGGDEGICHRSRGRASNNRISPKIKSQALRLFKQEYADFNPVHATEKLFEIHGIAIDWFEGRGPFCVFMGHNDDATGTVNGRFYDYEGTMPAMDSMKRYIRQYGIPQSVYLDKHTAYRSWARATIDEQLAGQEPQSHFEKSLAALSIEVIHANSPQAKGRGERLFKTLQDRLVREMRLPGIASIDEISLYRRPETGHFYFGKSRTFLLWVDNPQTGA